MCSFLKNDPNNNFYKRYIFYDFLKHHQTPLSTYHGNGEQHQRVVPHHRALPTVLVCKVADHKRAEHATDGEDGDDEAEREAELCRGDRSSASSSCGGGINGEL